MLNPEAAGDITTYHRSMSWRLPHIQGHYSVLVLHVAVDVKRLFELGKKYPWPRPKRCLFCQSSRLWGHGYVQRYFEGFIRPLWVHRLRCGDCHTVYTLRPDLFYRRFRYPVRTILWSLMTKIGKGFWLSCIPRQNQQYWFQGLTLQNIRFGSQPVPDLDMAKKMIDSGVIPATHSFFCERLRL